MSATPTRFRELQKIADGMHSGQVKTSPEVRRFFLEFTNSLRAETPGQAVGKMLQSLRSSPTPQDLYLDFDSACREEDITLADCLSEIGAECIRSAEGKTFQTAMSQAADLTGLSAIRFLSAWAALNTDDLSACIDECDRVDEPYGCIYTLQGQAYLESGMAKEAIDSLTLATKLSPDDVLSWFQLAKAHHILQQYEDAWHAISRCQRLAPMSPEVDLLAGMVAIALKDPKVHQTAWQGLCRHLSVCSDNVEAAIVLLNLVFLREDKPGLQQLVEGVDWLALMAQTSFTSHLSRILGELNRRGWHKESALLLEKLTANRAG